MILHIRERRLAAGLSQRELAAALRVAQPTLCLWEKGASYPSVPRLPALAAALECEIGELFREPEPRPVRTPEAAPLRAHDLT